MSLRILIVEDDVVNRHYLTELLDGLGHHCVACGSLAEARTALLNRQFDLILADWRLPDGRGDALDGEAPRLLLMSGDPSPDTALADRWLLKPVDPGRLLAMLGAEGRSPPSSSATGPHGAVLDDAAAARALGAGKATLDGLRRLLAAELQRELPLLEAAVRDGDLALISNRCHRLRAASALCGATRLGEACAGLEQSLQPGGDPTKAWRRCAAEAEALLQRMG